MTFKVAAYITAYQEEEAVQSTIQSLLQQSHSVNKVLILDNSAAALELSLDFDIMIVEHHPENIGVGGGLKWAISWAIDAAYDFLWALDQDSQLNPKLLEGLISQYVQLSTHTEKIGIIAPKIVDANTQQEFPGSSFEQYRIIAYPNFAADQAFYMCDTVITSGSLISLNAAKLVPLPKASYFLDAVDYDYCMGFRRAGYQIVVCKNLVLKHRIGRYAETRDRFKKEDQPISTFLCSPSRYYYACRNHTHLETRLASTRVLFKAVTYRFRILRMFIERILRYEPDQVPQKVAACIIGTVDGFFGRLGKTW